MKRLMFVVLICVPIALNALEVDSEELRPYRDTRLEFQNYEGPREVVQSADEIRGIGLFIGAQFRPEPATFSFFGRYSVIHAVDPLVDTGLDADIMLIAADARVDHINSLRLILSGYLEAAYQYSPADAGLLAEYISIYNAVFRGNRGFFETRYKPVVLQHLSNENVGLSLLYSDWPGGTEMVIPLRDGGRPGDLAAVGPQALIEPEVIDSLRELPDMGIDTRREMVELMERVIDQDTEAIEREREDVAAERAAVVEREQRQVQELTPTEREELAAQREQVERREAEITERERAVEDLTEDVRDLREDIARDTEALLERQEAERVAARPTPAPEEESEQAPAAAVVEPARTVFLLVRREGQVVVGRLARVDSQSGEEIVRSTLDKVYGRRFLETAGVYVLIADHDSIPRLTQVHQETLEPILFGTHEIAAGSMLVESGGAVFAVMREEDKWYLGRFTTELELLERSRVEVNPDTYIQLSGNRVYIQAREGTVHALNQSNMRTE